MSAGDAIVVDEASFEAMLQALHRFVWSELVPREAELQRRGSVPDDITRQMAGLGIFGLSIAPAYGGIGRCLTLPTVARPPTCCRYRRGAPAACTSSGRSTGAS